MPILWTVDRLIGNRFGLFMWGLQTGKKWVDMLCYSSFILSYFHNTSSSLHPSFSLIHLLPLTPPRTNLFLLHDSPGFWTSAALYKGVISTHPLVATLVVLPGTWRQLPEVRQPALTRQFIRARELRRLHGLCYQCPEALKLALLHHLKCLRIYTLMPV